MPVRWPIAAVAAALLTVGDRPAHAAALDAARFGGEHGNVTETNPTALYFNPAGLAFATGTHLFADGTLAVRRVTWTHAAADSDQMAPAGAEGANVGTARLLNVLGGPALGATTKLGDLGAGAGLFVPFGGRAHWDRNAPFASSPTFPLAVDGVQRWHAIAGSLSSIYLTAGAAYRFGRLSLGASGNVIRSSIYSVQAKTPTGDGTPDLEREGRAVLDVNGTHGSFGLGAMAELIDRTLWLAASYQAQPGLGPMQLDGTLTTYYQGGRTPFPATFHQALPDFTRVGARYRPSATVELRLFGQLARWSVMQTQCVGLRGQPCNVDPTGADATPNGTVLQNLRRKWNDSLSLRAGASHWLDGGGELFAGLGLETAAVPDSTLDPGLPDADNVALAAGLRWPLSHGAFLAGSYTHIQYANRDNSGASRLADAMPPTKRPDGGGKYTQWIGLFDVNLEVQF